MIVNLNPRRTVRGSAGLMRTLLILVTSTWGWMFIGLCALIGGLIWGFNSHHVAYVQGNQGFYALSTTTEGIILLQQDNTSNYYALQPGKFTQQDINLNPIENGQFKRFNFIASTDSVYVALELPNGVILNYAHPVEKITFYDQNGQNPVTYTNSDYSGNPDGYTINNWPGASLLILAGALCVGSMLFLIQWGRRHQKLALAAQRAALEAMPSPFARELADGQ